MKSDRMKIFALLTAVFIGVLIAGGAIAGTVGKITGVVTDKENGEGIPGVAVQIEGTLMGAVASFDGSYVILNVRPGTYTLVANTIGYNKMTVKEVKVQADLTTELNFQLTSVAVKTEDIIVTAEEKPIDKYVTDSQKKLSSEDISRMPVTNVSDVLRTTAGFVQQGRFLHARGGRSGEISYMIDGIEIKDHLKALSRAGQALRENLDISATDISELSVLKGNYDAEYGGSNSAIINIVRKEGDIRTTSGRMEYLTDDLGSERLNKYSFNSDYFEANLSGPIPAISDLLFPALGLKWPGEKMAYFMSFSVNKTNTYTDYNEYPSPNSKMDYGYEKFLGVKIPHRRSNQYTTSGKLTWKMDSNARYRLSLNYFKSWQKYTNFRWVMLYSPDGATQIEESKELYGATFMFSPSFLRDTFGELKVNRYIQEFEQKPGGLTPGDIVMYDELERYEDSNNNGKWDSAEPFIDINGDGFFGEPFNDNNLNGIFDPSVDVWVPYEIVDDDTVWIHDLNHNGFYDADIGEPYSDLNGSGRWDPAERIISDHYWADVNGNGVFDEPDSSYQIDGSGNGVYDPQLRSRAVWPDDEEEPYTDGDVVIGEPYIDVNLNGHFDGDTIDVFIGAWDLNNNGQYDGPDDPWSPGVPYRDLNNNGRYDPPNTLYDFGEPFADLNGNGRWDGADGFNDFGSDRRATYQTTSQIINTFSLDLTSQVNRQHEIKSGIKYQAMKMDVGDLRYPASAYTEEGETVGPWPERGIFRDFYTRTPKVGAFYFRDKMEYGEMIANIGLRFDFYIQADEIDMDVFTGTDVEGMDVLNSQNKISPRVAFSFPVSDKAKLFFNYGHFYQLPAFSNFFQLPTQGSSALLVWGNPNLDFEKTIAYELGIQYRLSRDYIVTLSGFYKDYYGLLNSIQEDYGPRSVSIWNNVDYARTRGAEFELEKRYGHFLAGSFHYEYTWAYGKSSDKWSNYRASSDEWEPVQEFPLDWDIRHQITVNGDIRAQRGRHPQIGVFKLPDDWSLNFIWRFKTGRPFTPKVTYPGLVLIGGQSAPENSKRMPSSSNVDLRFDKYFQISKLNYTASLRINNLFDSRNVMAVYEPNIMAAQNSGTMSSGTGLPDTEENYNGQIFTGRPIQKDPTNYGEGRQIQVGLSVNF